jgi:hypothetical protein
VDFEKGNTSKQINVAQQMKFIAAKQTLGGGETGGQVLNQ